MKFYTIRWYSMYFTGFEKKTVHAWSKQIRNGTKHSLNTTLKLMRLGVYRTDNKRLSRVSR